MRDIEFKLEDKIKENNRDCKIINYRRLSIKDVLGRNEEALKILRGVRDNIINNKLPESNPISLNGFDKGNRYKIFFRIFTKDFNSKYRDKCRYLSSDKIDVDKVKDKKIVIMENLELLNNNIQLQETILKTMDYCLDENIQVVLCSNNGIENLEISDSLKNKFMNGLIIYLEKINSN